jgi:HEPN domain-containing protein
MIKTKSDLIHAWCEKGRRDFITARNALGKNEEIFPDIICFHAQQSAEKYLKHILFSKIRTSQRHMHLKISSSWLL